MPAPKGNRFWEARSSHGRKPIFANPEELWEACKEYFKWVDDNPLQAAELVKYQGKANVKYSPRIRAMTIGGLCIFLDITKTSWDRYKESEDFSAVCAQVEEVIRSQKFAGAAADLLNANIIARDLGLHDHQEITTTIKDITDEPMDADEWLKRYSEDGQSKEVH